MTGRPADGGLPPGSADVENGSAGVVAVVVTYCSGRDAGACIASLAGQLRVTDRLAVVDNASPDASAETVAATLRSQEGLPEWRFIRSRTNRGFGRACNAAAAIWPRHHVLLLNPDAVVTSGALDTLRQTLAADPRLGAVGPRILRLDGSAEPGARRSLPAPGVAFGRLSRLDRVFPARFGGYNRLGEDPLAAADIDAGSGCCVLIRREAWEQVGGFDPRFFMYGEDLDLFFRLGEAGWVVRYQPEALVRHRKAASTDRRRSRMIVEFHRAMWQYYRKHHLRVRDAWLAPLVVLGLTIRTGVQLAVSWAGILTRRQDASHATSEMPAPPRPEANDSEPTVTAIIVNWNGREWLPRTLATLRAQIGVKPEIVVVDNASTDDSLSYLRACHDLAVVCSDVNVGFAGGMNLGLAHSSGVYVLALNPDVELGPSYLRILVGEMEARPRVAAASGVLFRPPHADGSVNVDSIGHRMLAGCWPENVGEGGPAPATRDEVSEVFGVCAAAGLYRRRALDDVRLPSGVFCEDYFAYLEDADLDMRLRARGWSAIVATEAVAHHRRSGTGAREMSFVRRHIVKNSLLLPVRTYPGRWMLRDLPPLVATRLGVVVQYTVASPSAIIGVADACRVLPRALRERRIIADTATVKWAARRRWIEPFPWRARFRRFTSKVRRRAV
jgi:GT2 family glycosyltransferase